MPRPDVTPAPIPFNHPADFDLSYRPHLRALEAFAAHYHHCMGGTPLPTSIDPLPPVPAPLPPHPTASQLTRYRRQLSRLANHANTQLLLIKPSSLSPTSIPSPSELFRRFASAIRASGRRISVTDPRHPSILPHASFATPYLTLLAPAYHPRTAPNLRLGPYALHLPILKGSYGATFHLYLELLDPSNMAACGSIWTNSSAVFRPPLPTRLLASSMCLGDAQYALIPEAIKRGNIMNALDAFLSVIDGYNPGDNSQRLSCWHIPSSTRISRSTGTDPSVPFEAPCPPPHLTLPPSPHWNLSDPVPSLNLPSFSDLLNSLLPTLASHTPPYLPPPTSLLPPPILNRDNPRSSGCSADQHFFDNRISTYDYGYRYYDLGRRCIPSAYLSPSNTVMQLCYFDRYFHPSPVPSFRHLQLPTRTTRFPSTPPHTLPSTLTFICTRCSNIRPLHEHSPRIPSCCLSCQSLPVPPLPRPTPPTADATQPTPRRPHTVWTSEYVHPAEDDTASNPRPVETELPEPVRAAVASTINAYFDPARLGPTAESTRVHVEGTRQGRFEAATYTTIRTNPAAPPVPTPPTPVGQRYMTAEEIELLLASQRPDEPTATSEGDNNPDYEPIPDITDQPF